MMQICDQRPSKQGYNFIAFIPHTRLTAAPRCQPISRGNDNESKLDAVAFWLLALAGVVLDLRRQCGALAARALPCTRTRLRLRLVPRVEEFRNRVPGNREEG